MKQKNLIALIVGLTFLLSLPFWTFYLLAICCQGVGFGSTPTPDNSNPYLDSLKVVLLWSLFWSVLTFFISVIVGLIRKYNLLFVGLTVGATFALHIIATIGVFLFFYLIGG